MIQLLLGLWAFRRGWRWRVLWPVAGAIALAVLMVAAGVDPTGNDPILLVPDILADLALLAMAIMRPQPAATVAEEQVQEMVTQA